MRVTVLVVVFLLLLCPELGVCQDALPSAPDVSNWRPVQDLPLGTALHMKTTSRGLTCQMKSVDATSITCANAGTSTFQVSEIKSIKQVHRGRSALVGSLIGIGVGAIIGAATAESCSAQEKSIFPNCFITVSRAGTALIGGVVFGVIGAPVGYFTDFTRSTVYKAH